MFAVIAVAVSLLVQDPVRVGMSLSYPNVRTGEATVLEVTVVTRGTEPDSIVLPQLPAALRVVSTSDMNETQISFPGGRSQTLRRQLALVGTAPGRYQIDPVAVWVRGRRYMTKAVTLNVTGAPAPGIASRSRAPDDEVVLQASATPDEVYVGQQVTLRVDALFSEDVRSRLRSAPEYQPPNPSGFWVYDLPNPIAVDFRRLRDQFYEVQTFRRAYFPLSPGTFVLPPAKLIYDVREGFLNTPETRELNSAPVRIVVRPVPQENRPASFTGAVGRFMARAHLEPATVPAGEAATLTLEVEGQGNLKALPPPKLPDITGVQVYPPSEETTLRVADGTVQGSKRFSWVLIPERPGRLEIPSVEYSFFDPSRRTFGVSRTATLYLDVSPGARPGATRPPATTLRPPAAAPYDESLEWVRTRTFAVVQLVPLLALALVVWRRRAARNPKRPGPRELRAALDAELTSLDRNGMELPHDAFFARLEIALRRWIAGRFDDGLERATPEQIERALTAADVSAELAAETAQTIRRIDHARYEPISPTPEQRRDTIAQVRALVDRLEPAAKERRSTRTPLLVATLICASALTPRAGSAEQAVPTFESALSAFRAGAFPEAARRFEAYIALHPTDANAWYDLGNSFFRQGQLGRASWAWLRALQYHPRDANARYNLQLAGVEDRAVAASTPPLRMTENELLLTASLLWFAGAAVLLLSFRRRQRSRLLFIGGCAVLLAIVFAGTATLRRFTPQQAVAFGTPALLSGPAYRADRVRALRDGEMLRVIEKESEFVRVRAEDGNEGWVQSSQVGVI